MAADDHEERDCSSCDHRLPDMTAEELEIWDCLVTCESQFRIGPTGPVSLDWSVVLRVAEAKGVRVDHRFFRLMKAFEAALIRMIGKSGGEDG